MPKAKTYHEGANDERTAILAKVRRMIGQVYIQEEGSSIRLFKTLEAWLLGRNERYKKKQGGL